MADTGDWVPLKDGESTEGAFKVPFIPVTIVKAFNSLTQRAQSVASKEVAKEKGLISPSKEALTLTTTGFASVEPGSNISPLNSYLMGKDSGTYTLDTEFSLSTRLSSGTYVKYFFEMFPAVRSVSGAQGMQAPDVDHGLSFKSSINVAKINIPGSVPVYQTMGISDEIIEFVGAFIGEYPTGYTTADDFVPDALIDYRSVVSREVAETPLIGPTPSNALVDSNGNPVPEGLYEIPDVTNQIFRAYQESSIIRKLQLNGSVCTLTLKSKSLVTDRLAAFKQSLNSLEQSTEIKDGIDMVVEGYIIGFERFIQRDDRVWYKIVFRVTNHNFDDSVTQFSLTGGSTMFAQPLERVFTDVAGRSINVATPDLVQGPLREETIPTDRARPISPINREPEPTTIVQLTPQDLVGGIKAGNSASINSPRAVNPNIAKPGAISPYEMPLPFFGLPGEPPP